MSWLDDLTEELSAKGIEYGIRDDGYGKSFLLIDMPDGTTGQVTEAITGRLSIFGLTLENVMSIVETEHLEAENAKLRHNFSDACVRFFNASRDCEHLRDDLAILTHKHECLISAVTHGLVSKVQTPNEEVELLVREYWERERQEIEDENERLKGRLDNLEDHDQYMKTALAEVGCDECGEYKQDAHRLYEEVVKLRELVRHLYECMCNIDMYGNHECFSCEYENTDGLCDYERLMRELGVEVNE